jgi:hypothetical protein
MLTVQVTQVIYCTPDEMLRFVMDPEQYAAIDRKIRPVRWVHREGNVVEFPFRARVAGIPGPVTVSRMTLTPGRRVDVALAPPPANRISRMLSDFTASFDCTPVENGTKLVRTLNFGFNRLLRGFAERFLRARIQAEVEEEIRLAKEYLERDRHRPAPT